MSARIDPLSDEQIARIATRTLLRLLRGMTGAVSAQTVVDAVMQAQHFARMSAAHQAIERARLTVAAQQALREQARLDYIDIGLGRRPRREMRWLRAERRATS